MATWGWNRHHVVYVRSEGGSLYFCDRSVQLEARHGHAVLFSLIVLFVCYWSLCDFLCFIFLIYSPSFHFISFYCDFIALIFFDIWFCHCPGKNSLLYLIVWLPKVLAIYGPNRLPKYCMFISFFIYFYNLFLIFLFI